METKQYHIWRAKICTLGLFVLCMIHLVASHEDYVTLTIINDAVAIIVILGLMIYVIRKQINLVHDLNKALFFHQLVNKNRVMKYFVMNDLWIFQLLTLYSIILILESKLLFGGDINEDHINDIYLFMFFFVGLNPLNLLIKWTIVSFEDFQILLIELHSRINMLSGQLVLNHDSDKN